MRTMPLALAATLALACAACATTTPEHDTTPTDPTANTPSAAAPPPMAAECQATAAQQFVGQKATPEVLEAARVAAGAAVARALRPDMMVTMEYRGDRLNLRTDTNDVVASVGCG
jgi:hypothetical protein